MTPVTPEHLRTVLNIAIRTAPDRAKRLLSARNPLERDEGAAILAAHLTTQIQLDRWEISRPDPVIDRGM